MKTPKQISEAKDIVTRAMTAPGVAEDKQMCLVATWEALHWVEGGDRTVLERLIREVAKRKGEDRV